MSCLKMKFKLNSVEKILDYNNQNQERKGLKILTTEQILNRIPIFFSSLRNREQLMEAQE